MISMGLIIRTLRNKFKMSVLIALFYYPMMQACSQHKMDSLEAIFKTEKIDTIKINVMNRLVGTYVEEERQTIIRSSLLTGFVLMLILVTVISKAYRQKQKFNKLLEMKNEMIEEQSRSVEQKNKDILNSINSAKRVQESLLPSEALIERTLNRLQNH
jgi:hypothetical protein